MCDRRAAVAYYLFTDSCKFNSQLEKRIIDITQHALSRKSCNLRKAEKREGVSSSNC